MSDQKMPQHGGSYTRNAKGELTRTGGTKPAPLRPKPEPQSAPENSPKKEG